MSDGNIVISYENNKSKQPLIYPLYFSLDPIISFPANKKVSQFTWSVENYLVSLDITVQKKN